MSTPWRTRLESRTFSTPTSTTAPATVHPAKARSPTTPPEPAPPPPPAGARSQTNGCPLPVWVLRSHTTGYPALVPDVWAMRAAPRGWRGLCLVGVKSAAGGRRVVDAGAVQRRWRTVIHEPIPDTALATAAQKPRQGASPGRGSAYSSTGGVGPGTTSAGGITPETGRIASTRPVELHDRIPSTPTTPTITQPPSTTPDNPSTCRLFARVPAGQPAIPGVVRSYRRVPCAGLALGRLCGGGADRNRGPRTRYFLSAIPRWCPRPPRPAQYDALSRNETGRNRPTHQTEEPDISPRPGGRCGWRGRGAGGVGGCGGQAVRVVRDQPGSSQAV